MSRLRNFQKEWIRECAIINAPMNKVELTVASTPTIKNYVPPTEPGKSGKYIVTLKAIAPDQLPKLKALFPPGVTEVPIEETNGLFLSAAIWKDEEDGPEPQLPIKGEKILCNIGYVLNRDKTARLLRITGDIQLQPATKAETIDMESFFAVEDAPVDEKNENDRFAKLDEQHEEANSDVLQQTK